MPANLYPLLYKPGILRDGTRFQAEYCTAGYGVRFQRGKIKKMGGIQGISLKQSNNVVPANVSDITMVGTNIIIASHSTGITKVQLRDYTPYPEFISTTRATPMYTVPNTPALLWNVLKIVSKADGLPYLIFMPTMNAQLIDSNVPMDGTAIKVKALSTLNDNTFNATGLTGVNPLSNGGMCFVAPYLFLYGSNGIVQYSKSSTPFEFADADGGSGELKISTDKVIFGAPIRGGSNSPCLLFWTLSSVARITNVGSNLGVLFKTDVISNSSSVLSSRSIIEYDGLFFWAGTERFFVYNGIVQEMDNRMNLNYFFDNIDMDRRQEVFAFKNTRYGEIGWAYPVRGVAGVTMAVIYNKRENYWYDTPMPRTAALFSSENGYLITAGSPLTPLPGDTGNYLWKHEVEVFQNWYPDSLGGATQRLDRITATITTPTISLAAFPPGMREEAQGGRLINRWVELKSIEPDFIGVTGAPTGITVNVNVREYAQTPITVGATAIFTTTTGKVDIRAQGRNLSLTFVSNGAFEMGNTLLLLGIGDGR